MCFIENIKIKKSKKKNNELKINLRVNKSSCVINSITLSTISRSNKTSRFS